MVKIIFVCYDAGAGGERMATDISQLANVYDLNSKTVGTRTVTRDVTKGISRYDIFKQRELQSIIDNLPIDKWHVIPTHFKPEQLEELSCVKFYVVIYAGNTTSEKEINQNQKDKVWKHVFTDPLELKGQIEAHDADPNDGYITSRLKGPVQYGLLWSVINRIDPISDDLEREYDIYCSKDTYRTPSKLENCMNIEYSDCKLPTFKTQFTKKLQDQLTKYS